MQAEREPREREGAAAEPSAESPLRIAGIAIATLAALSAFWDDGPSAVGERVKGLMLSGLEHTLALSALLLASGMFLFSMRLLRAMRAQLAERERAAGELSQNHAALQAAHVALSLAEQRARLLRELAVATQTVPIELVPEVALMTICDRGPWSMAELIELEPPPRQHFHTCHPWQEPLRQAIAAMGPERIETLVERMRASDIGLRLFTADAKLLPTAEAEAASIAGARALPVLIQGELAAVLVVYCSLGAALDGEWSLTLTQVAAELGLVLELKAGWAEARKLAMIAQETDDAVLVLDRNGLIEWTNPGFTRITGYALPEVLGRRPGAVLAGPESDMTAVAAFGVALREGGKIRKEVLCYHKSGRKVWLGFSMQPVLGHDGKVDCFISLGADVTARKEVELAALKAKEQAEAASRAKSAFLATISHEIRTPLNGILGMIELLGAESLEPEHRQMLEVVKHSSLALLQLIEDVLDFSKIEADRLELDAVPVELEALIEGVAGTLSPLAQKRSHRFLLDAAAGTRCLVKTDPLRLRQVLFNLASNAIKFTETRPERVGRVEIRAELEPGERERATLVVRVCDNGIGMSSRTLSEVFEPFVQADASTTRRFGGTGLGLSIVKRLCDLAGGSVEVESAVGIGTVFTVRWPLEILETRTSPAPLAGVRALVALSDPAQAALAARYLEGAGASARVIASAELEARAAETGADLWLLDEAALERANRAALAARSVRKVMIAAPGTRLDADCAVVSGTPLLRTRLIETIAVALGRSSTPESPRVTPAGTGRGAEPFAEERGSGAHPNTRILVAEDNEINQAVLARQLASLGYAAEMVRNGREALERLKTRRYALLLTDCHMPELDGFELARAIRRSEARDQAPLPIIAITANAVGGEAERCLAAGMNGHLAKPIALRALEQVLADWLEQQPARGPDTAVDPNVLAQLLGSDDPGLHAEFFHRFALQATEIVCAIAAATPQHDRAELRAQAHKLKSSASAVGAGALADACVALERAANASDHAQLAQLASGLERELARVRGEIDRFIQGVKAANRRQVSESQAPSA